MGTPRQRARALAAFFAAGGTLGLSSVLAPGWDGVRRPGVATVCTVALLIAAALWTGGKRVPAWACQLMLAAGSGLIAGVLYFGSGGAATATYASFSGWVAVYAFWFFSRRVAVGHTVLVLGAMATALVGVGEGRQAGVQMWVLGGTIGTAGLIVSRLAGHLRSQAETDELTDLPNRRAFDSTLRRALAAGARSGTPVSLLLLDLDGFKALNDRHGHAHGDHVLRDVAHRWRAELRAGDLLARIGGDEFGAILAAADRPDVDRTTHRLRVAMPPGVGVSLGAAVWDGREDAEALVDRADRLLYREKSGRDLPGRASPAWADALEPDPHAAGAGDGAPGAAGAA